MGVLHEIGAAATRFLAGGPPSSSSHDVVVAFIGTIGGLLGALISVLGRRRSSDEPRHPLNSGSDDDDDLEDELRLLRTRVRTLEIVCWRRRLNPNRVITGDETDEDLRF